MVGLVFGNYFVDGYHFVYVLRELLLFVQVKNVFEFMGILSLRIKVIHQLAHTLFFLVFLEKIVDIGI